MEKPSALKVENNKLTVELKTAETATRQTEIQAEIKIIAAVSANKTAEKK